MAGVNKQPIFTLTPILVTTTIDPPIIDDNYNTGAGAWNVPPDTAYTAVTSTGILIDRITISATGDLTNSIVDARLIYLYIGSNGKYSLYNTIAMPPAVISSTVANPQIELVFTGGLLLNNGDHILIGASENAANSGQNGNHLSITIEGGNYDTA